MKIVATIVSIFVTASILIVGYVLIHLKNKKDKEYDDFVLGHSQALKQLDYLNSIYQFSKVSKINLLQDYDNENIYNGIFCEDYLIYYLRDHEEKVNHDIKAADENKKMWEDYTSRLRIQVEPFLGKFNAEAGKLKKERLDKIEHDYFRSKLKGATISLTAFVNLRLTKINGALVKGRERGFSQDEIISYLNRLDDQEDGFYLDDEIWNSLCRVERGKVTNKLRFYIYNRDGNRCVHCGSRENLEVDHIIPISKGGKTVVNNLQTLCHRCNVEKGAKSHF